MRLTKRQFLIRWGAMTALLTLVGLLFSLNAYLTSQRPLGPLSILITQLLPFLIWAVLCPAVIRLDPGGRVKERTWPRLIAFHLLATAFFSFAQIALYGFSCWALLALTTPDGSSLAEVYRVVFPRIVLGVVVYKIIVTTNYALDYYEKYRAEQQRAARLEAHLAQAQLQALKMQLQPHFLFNTLNSISSLALEDGRAAVRMISRLGDFLRLTIENNGTQEVSLKRELEFLTCYLEIQQVRFDDRLRVTLDVEPEALGVRVPNLILQPLVENAIKHGIAPRADAGCIGISARLKSEALEVRVSNDGLRRPETKPGNGNGNGSGNHFAKGKSESGVGIANTRERLRQMYQDRFHLDLVLLDEGGAVCTLEIPLTKGGADG